MLNLEYWLDEQLGISSMLSLNYRIDNKNYKMKKKVRNYFLIVFFTPTLAKIKLGK